MRLNRTWIVLGMALTFALAGLMSAYAASSQGRPTAVAAVEVGRVFEAVAERKQISADLQSQADSLKQEEENRRKEIAALESDLQILAPGTPAYDQKEAEMEKKTYDLQAWAAYQKKKVTREQGIQYEHLYNTMLDAISRFAAENHYDLVLFKEKNPDFRGATLEQLLTVIQSRKMLWSAEDLDITDQIIQMMDNEYRNREAQ